MLNGPFKYLNYLGQNCNLFSLKEWNKNTQVMQGISIVTSQLFTSVDKY